MVTMGMESRLKKAHRGIKINDADLLFGRSFLLRGDGVAKFKPIRFMAEDSKYNKKAADYAVSFIECLSHTKGTWAGKKFELLDWQEQIIRDLFGILKPNGYRQFNTAYIEIPKKMARVSLQLPSLCY